MGIFENDNYRIDDDLFKEKKPQDTYKIDYRFDHYGNAMAHSPGNSAGDQSGAFPSALPDRGKTTFNVAANNYGQPQLDPIEIKPEKPPAVEPINPVPAVSVKPAVKPDHSILDRSAQFLNRVAQPELDASANTANMGLKIKTETRLDPSTAIDFINKIAEPERDASRDQGTLGLHAREEAQFDPIEAAGILNRMAQHDRDTSADRGTPGIHVAQEATVAPQESQRSADTVNERDHTGMNDKAERFNPDYVLSKLRSGRSMKRMADMLTSLNRSSDARFRMASDRVHAMTQWYNAQFDAGVINGYSSYERRLAEDRISTALNKREEVTYDPEMAKMQILPYLDRFNSPHGYDTDAANSGFSNARFSIDTLREQVRDHMFNGSRLTYQQAEQAAQAMASLDNTAYGKTIRNFMGSVGSGFVNVGQEAIHAAATAFSTLPPPEIALFHYQQMYMAHGNDTAGFAREVEDMAMAGNRMADAGYAKSAGVKDKFAGIRTDNYNDLRYFTLDPARMTLMRPDKLTGDFFEKFLPSVVSLYLPTRAAAVTGLRQGARLLTQFTWIAKRAFNTAATEKLIELQRNPALVDNDPAFKRYMRDSPYAQSDPQRAREYFMQGAARKSGLQGACVAVVTFGVSRAFRYGTSDGKEGPFLQMLQQFILHEGKNMGDEAINAVNKKDFDNVNEIGGARQEG